MFDLQRRSMRGLYKMVYHMGHSGPSISKLGNRERKFVSGLGEMRAVTFNGRH